MKYLIKLKTAKAVFSQTYKCHDNNDDNWKNDSSPLLWLLAWWYPYKTTSYIRQINRIYWSVNWSAHHPRSSNYLTFRSATDVLGTSVPEANQVWFKNSKLPSFYPRLIDSYLSRLAYLDSHIKSEW